MSIGSCNLGIIMISFNSCSKKTTQALILGGLILSLCSCSTYNQRIATYYAHMKDGNYAQANKDLDRNKLLKKDRNKLLYMLEKGKVYHMLRMPDSSNAYLNKADAYMEQARATVKDVAVGTLVNPMMQTYKGEDFEKFMIHYYKALNYIYLGQKDDAMVEARRISLQTQEQKDKFRDKTSRYSKDAFSMMLQGIIYESGGDVNNAFIAYRNAAEVYLNSAKGVYYGVSMPKQLQLDVIRTAYLNGFQSEQDRFERLFGIKYQPKDQSDGGELILFWENGFAPVKDQQEFFFSMARDQVGFYFTDPSGNRIPFVGVIGSSTVNLSDLRTFRVTFPKYTASPLYYTAASVSLSDGNKSQLEKVEDINELAFATLRQRFLTEMATTLSRLAVKKITEQAIRGHGKDEVANGITGALQLYSLLSEKADTRNWQTLPSAIYYTRIPLKKGKNDIQLMTRSKSGADEVHTVTVEGTGGLAFYNYISLK